MFTLFMFSIFVISLMNVFYIKLQVPPANFKTSTNCPIASRMSYDTEHKIQKELGESCCREKISGSSISNKKIQFLKPSDLYVSKGLGFNTM